MFTSGDHDKWHVKLIDFGLAVTYRSRELLTDRVGTIYTMAPEVISSAYSQKADIWSVGVMAFQLLSGTKPFWGATRREVARAVVRSEYNFDDPAWADVSEDAKMFVEFLLTVEPEQRPSSGQALQYPWLRGSSTVCLSKKSSLSSRSHNSDPELDDSQCEILDNLPRYGESTDFRKIALHVVARHSDSRDLDELRSMFRKLDTNNDGYITYDEFSQCLKATERFRAEEIESLFKNFDRHNSNRISYLDFLAATIETQGRIDEENLVKAFEELDSDNSGYISKEDLQRSLGLRARIIEKMIHECDRDGDGKISFLDFKQAITSVKTH
jgi:calcium-dependent protein kinase